MSTRRRTLGSRSALTGAETAGLGLRFGVVALVALTLGGCGHDDRERHVAPDSVAPALPVRVAATFRDIDLDHDTA